jgi:hypothetical protein
MKKPEKIIQTCFSVDSETYENYMVILFAENNLVISSHVIRFPKWFKYYDQQYRYYIFSHN